jgi:hypothetical protein
VQAAWSPQQAPVRAGDVQGFGAQLVPSPRYTLGPVQAAAGWIEQTPWGVQHAPVAPEEQGLGTQTVPAPRNTLAPVQAAGGATAQIPCGVQQAPSSVGVTGGLILARSDQQPAFRPAARRTAATMTPAHS